MRLLKIKINDFRQYNGRNQLDIASEPRKHVTMLYGANGSGKTTLLNAFRWVLYGTFSDDVELPHEVINKSTWDLTPLGEPVACSVELNFEHGGSVFTAKRSIETARGDVQREISSKFLLMETDSVGNTTEVAAPNSKIDSIMPSKLADFFFFNGERIERLVQPDAYKEVESSIKRMLGIEHMESAESTLRDVVSKLNKEFSAQAGGEVEKLQQRSSLIEEEINGTNEMIDESERNLVSLRIELNRVVTALGDNRVVGEQVKQRESIKEEIRGVKSEALSLRSERQKLIGESGFAFSRKLTQDFGILAEGMVKAGELPSGVQQSFLDGLLEQHECICGAALTESGPGWQKIAEKKRSAGIPEQQEVWMNLKGQIGLFSERRDGLRTKIADFDSRLDALNVKEADRTAKVTDLDLLIGGQQADDVQRLEGHMNQLSSSIDKENRELGIQRNKVEEKLRQKLDLEKQIQQAVVQGQHALLAKARKEAASNVRVALQKMLVIRTSYARSQLDEKIREIFAKITIKETVPRLSANFQLELFETDGLGNEVPVARSTGENQILSLSFIAAILDYVGTNGKNMSSADMHLGTGGQYPIVMDAAFGSLDENYQRDVARALRILAPQIVVLVSKSQGTGTVYDELDGSIGSLGVIVAHTTNSDNKSEEINLQGKMWPYVVSNSDINRAELLEIS